MSAVLGCAADGGGGVTDDPTIGGVRALADGTAADAKGLASGAVRDGVVVVCGVSDDVRADGGGSVSDPVDAALGCDPNGTGGGGQGSTVLELVPAVVQSQGLRVLVGYEGRLSVNGRPVVAQVVHFSAGGTERCRATTDANGVARCTDVA